MGMDNRGVLGLDADIRRAGPAATAYLSARVRGAITELLDDARALVAKDSGDLEKSIVVRNVRPLSGVVETRSPYSTFQEWGTTRQPGKPYLMPAADRAQARLVLDAEAAIGRALT